MITYFKNSIAKFKQDAFSKAIYDIVKYLLGVLFLVILSWLIPEDTTFGEFISQELIIKYYWVIIGVLILIILTIILVYKVFKIKYNVLAIDNYSDELTGLKNHKALKKILEEEIIELENQPSLIASIILIDIDDFKQFNTNYGYNVADTVLQKVGLLLANDRRATDETFRFYHRGDEFLILAKDTSATNALKAAERKRKLIEDASFMVDGSAHKITVSCGVTEYKYRLDNYVSLTDRAIDALARAKKINGKNCSKLLV